MSYYVYENWRVRPKKAKIHIGECRCCNYGKGIDPDASDRNGRWHGPFATFEEAHDAAESTSHPVTFCKRCTPFER